MTKVMVVGNKRYLIATEVADPQPDYPVTKPKYTGHFKHKAVQVVEVDVDVQVLKKPGGVVAFHDKVREKLP